MKPFVTRFTCNANLPAILMVILFSFITCSVDKKGKTQDGNSDKNSISNDTIKTQANQKNLNKHKIASLKGRLTWIRQFKSQAHVHIETFFILKNKMYLFGNCTGKTFFPPDKTIKKGGFLATYDTAGNCRSIKHVEDLKSPKIYHKNGLFLLMDFHGRSFQTTLIDTEKDHEIIAKNTFKTNFNFLVGMGSSSFHQDQFVFDGKEYIYLVGRKNIEQKQVGRCVIRNKTISSDLAIACYNLKGEKINSNLIQDFKFNRDLKLYYSHNRVFLKFEATDFSDSSFKQLYQIKPDLSLVDLSKFKALMDDPGLLSCLDIKPGNILKQPRWLRVDERKRLKDWFHVATNKSSSASGETQYKKTLIQNSCNRAADTIAQFTHDGYPDRLHLVGIQKDQAGNTYFGISYIGRIKGEPLSLKANSYLNFSSAIVKVAQNGSVAWIKKIRGEGGPTLKDLVLFRNANLYAIGGFSKTTKVIDTSLNANAWHDAFLMKLE